MLINSFQDFIALTAKCPSCGNCIFSPKEIETQKLDCIFSFRNSGPFSATLDFHTNKTHFAISNQGTTEYLMIACEKCNYHSYFTMKVKEASKILPQEIELYSEFIETSDKHLFTSFHKKDTTLSFINNKGDILKKIDLKFKPVIEYKDILHQLKYDALI